MRRGDLLQLGIGRSLYLSDGPAPAIRGVGLGVFLGIPFGLSLVALGAAEGTRAGWVQLWWQPLIAVAPGISEEAWARVFLVPLLFAVFRRSTSDRMALRSAVLLAGYWFATSTPLGRTAPFWLGFARATVVPLVTSGP
jgi:hypothetical protein